jgi:hypothetical protein
MGRKPLTRRRCPLFAYTVQINSLQLSNNAFAFAVLRVLRGLSLALFAFFFSSGDTNEPRIRRFIAPQKMTPQNTRF